jgi:hypothetical protein
MRRRNFVATLAGAASLPFGVVAQERKLTRLAMVHPFQPVEVMSRTPRLSESNRAFLDNWRGSATSRTKPLGLIDGLRPESLRAVPERT